MSWEDLLRKIVSLANSKLPPLGFEKIIEYVKILNFYNKKINLTSAKDVCVILADHIADSLVVSNFIDNTYVDIGTGGGFPGIIVAITRPQIKVTLIEAKKKKADFLKKVVSELYLKNTQVICARAENVAKEIREFFYYATARGVANLSTCIELAVPLLKVKGLFLAQKGKEPQHEIDNAKEAFDKLYCKLQNIYFYQLPLLGHKRSIIFIEKLKETLLCFPRRVGIPYKRPL